MTGVVNSTGARSGAVGTTVGTPSSNAADIGAGVLPVGVTGGSGLTALGTVTAGNLSNTAIVYPAGHILQVVHMQRTSGATTSTSTTASAISSLVLSITPKYTSSKIYFLANVHAYIAQHTADQWSALRLEIDRTVTGGSAATIWTSAASGDTYTFGQFVTDTTSREMGKTTISHLDSPSYSLTNGISYQVMLASSQAAEYTVMSDYTHGYSEITLMEVAG
jgi:hypothetical protein